MCVFCKGKTEESKTEYIEKYKNYVVVINDVPCKKCIQCGETYFSNEVVQKIYDILNELQPSENEITLNIVDFVSVAA